MGKCRDFLLSALFIAVVSLAMPTYADAATPSCTTAADATGDCGQFGSGNIIEFLGTASATCGTLPCTEYKYRYTGTSTNQIEFLIPKAVQTNINTSALSNCFQLIVSTEINPGGNSTTGFGVNILTHNLCKLPANLATLTQFSIYADPSTAKPLSWEVSFGKTVRADTIKGPAVPGDKIAETAATLTTSEGVSVSYTNAGGVITPTGGRVVPISRTKLCVVKPSAPSSPVFPNDYTCETISFATDQCDIKTTGTDPCRFIGGSALCY